MARSRARTGGGAGTDGPSSGCWRLFQLACLSCSFVLLSFAFIQSQGVGTGAVVTWVAVDDSALKDDALSQGSSKTAGEGHSWHIGEGGKFAWAPRNDALGSDERLQKIPDQIDGVDRSPEALLDTGRGPPADETRSPSVGSPAMPKSALQKLQEEMAEIQDSRQDVVVVTSRPPLPHEVQTAITPRGEKPLKPEDASSADLATTQKTRPWDETPLFVADSQEASEEQDSRRRRRRRKTSKEFLSKGQGDNRDWTPPPSKSALCIVGHMRTFGLTYDSIEKFAVRNQLDVYMMLIKGQKVGSTHLRFHAESPGRKVESAIEAEVRLRAKNPVQGGMNIRDVAVAETGGCGEYRQSFLPKQKRLKSSTCRETGTHSQIRWMRYCFDMVLRTGIKYQRLIRTRPDVGIFGDIVLKDYPLNMIANWKTGSPAVAGDWFFFLPFDQLEQWWGTVEGAVAGQTGNWPFPDFFMYKRIRTMTYHLPAVLVRSPHLAECCRFLDGVGKERRTNYAGLHGGPDGRQMEHQCVKSLRSGLFSRFPEWLQGTPLFDDKQFRSCNIDNR
eukprot:TRINITY_DN28437_c0_g1_i1.p1 TRINITY_DN28437_c0_g1~~TRINITY_DN28437_c0_g1_i1.p1  ORF type:complete len:558 (-),score=55.65 TRINITY_DN28437_c0_g1_i1:671-2344(-)